jgi:hypothetical protein
LCGRGEPRIGLQRVFPIAGLGELDDVFIAVLERAAEQVLPGGRCGPRGVCEAARLGARAAGEHQQQRDVHLPHGGHRCGVQILWQLSQHNAQGRRGRHAVDEWHRRDFRMPQVHPGECGGHFTQYHGGGPRSQRRQRLLVARAV